MKERSLKPCCNGRGSKTQLGSFNSDLATKVLILVVMEEGQRRAMHKRMKRQGGTVLILVVMEEGQRPSSCGGTTRCKTTSLNPCCNGRGSKTPCGMQAGVHGAKVLILVVMEEGQRLRGVKYPR